MHRRTLIKAGSTAMFSALYGISEAWASCQATYELPLSVVGTSIEEPIEALFDRKYDKDHWEFSEDMALRVRHPDFSEMEHVVPFNVRLDTLPRGMARCTQVEVYRRKKITIISGTDRNARMANWRVGSCFPANVLPMEYGTRYRDSEGKGQLFVALSFMTFTGVRRVLVYRHPVEVMTDGECQGPVYSHPDANKRQAEAVIKAPSKATIKTRFTNMQDYMIFIMLMYYDTQPGFRSAWLIPVNYITQLGILIGGKVVARCELGPSTSFNPFISLSLPLHAEGTQVQIAYEDIQGNRHVFDTVVEYWIPKPSVISPE